MGQDTGRSSASAKAIKCLRNSGSDPVQLGLIAYLAECLVAIGDSRRSLAALPNISPAGIARRPDVDPGDLSNVVALAEAEPCAAA
jgi:hypothetical protein